MDIFPELFEYLMAFEIKLPIIIETKYASE